MRTWIISDTHFGHSNIIRYCNRPFKSVEEMDSTMIKNWNSVVSEDDLVYHLGDVAFSKDYQLEAILDSLNGRKRLVLGNHDHGQNKVLHKYFEEIEVSYTFKKEKIIFTHYPLHQSSLFGKDMMNIHGHIHEKNIKDSNYKNVSVEQINYTPVLFDSLKTSPPYIFRKIES